MGCRFKSGRGYEIGLRPCSNGIGNIMVAAKMHKTPYLSRRAKLTVALLLRAQPIDYYRPGGFPDNLKQCVMKIIEFKATTSYTGLIVSVRGTYAEKDAKRAYNALSEKAFAIYKAKVEAAPEHLSKYEMRFCLWESEPNKDGIFRTVRTIYRDFLLIDGKVALQKEQVFNK